jgi:hypothetical protein
VIHAKVSHWIRPEDGKVFDWEREPDTRAGVQRVDSHY